MQKKNPNRISVFLDDEYAFGVSRFIGGWLEIGQELTPEKEEELRFRDSIESAYNRAINFLSYRQRSINEVERNLAKHNIDDEIIEQVIGKLINNNLVSDLQFALNWVENRNEFRPRSKRALRLELYRKGIRDEVINEALRGFDDLHMAERLARKNHRRFEHMEWIDYRKKMTGILARRGFNYTVISEVVRDTWEAEKPST